MGARSTSERPGRVSYFVLLLLLFSALELAYVCWLPSSVAYASYLRGTAECAARALRLLGLDSRAEGFVLHLRGDAIAVRHGCDSLETTGLLLLAIALYPGNVRSKVLASVAGIAVLYALNVVRLGALAGLVRHGSAFAAVHLAIGPIALVLAAVAIWTAWAKWNAPARAR